MNKWAHLAALGILFCAAGCRGASTTPGLLQQSFNGKPAGTASFSITVPAPVRGTPSMQSLTVALAAVNGALPAAAVAPVKMNLARNVSGCAPAPGGALLCTASIPVPAGKDTFIVSTYSQPNQLGTRLTTSQVVTAISAGRATKCVKKTAGSSV